MKVLISGATGFIGKNLVKSLLENNHQVHAIVRAVNDSRLEPNVIQVTTNTLIELDDEFDVFINLAGENIAAKPWSEKRKAALFDSRVALTKKIECSLQHIPKRIISMSAVGFYGVARHGVFDEETPPREGFAHDLCLAWENAAKSFQQADSNTKVTIFRLGVVLGKGGALQKMRLPFLVGLGGPIDDGKQWFPWIHMDDVTSAIMLAMVDDAYEGTFNLVAPEAVQQKEFAKCYAASLNRPAFMPTPKWLLNLIFGEMASLLTEGPKITSHKLERRGFKFQFSQLSHALQEIESS